MTAYYNENNPDVAEWLCNLIAAGHIAPGDVDTRSIEDVRPDDLHGYTQCHFFAGIGLWSLALRLAGWPDDREVWTASCPCQPFSTAGAGAGFSDERHLWPSFHHLVAERRPSKVFGEQVASSRVNSWIDLVHADLEAVDYAFGCVPFPAAGVGAPHIRDRAYWYAERLAHPKGERCEGDRWAPARQGERRIDQCRQDYIERAPAAALAGGWRDVEWIECDNGIWRPIEPGIAPLVDGDTGRLVRVRAYGNAINPETARVFIECVMGV